ncbi:MAG: helix-turn-helix transcriptional regulator [Firmicutes bacterium]|nr:helix-turn-helix transcriptional regulator [Bacillota bacterium]
MPPWLLGHQWSGDSPGARLRQARVSKNMTIRDLSADTGLSVTAIGNLEADKFNAVLPNLRALANALGVPVAYLGCFERLPESTLGQRITKARMYHGFTKDEMARVIGVDPKTLRLWEQDKHQPLQRYSTVLNTYMAILDE